MLCCTGDDPRTTMDDLRDKAKGSVEAERAADLDGTYRVESTALYDADEVSAEGEYPEYGSWLRLDGGSYLECPRGLAAVLVEELDEDHSGPFTLTVENVTKDPDSGEFRFVAGVGEE